MLSSSWSISPPWALQWFPTWASTKPAMPSSRRRRSWRTLMLGRWAGSSEGFANAGLESGSRPWSSPDRCWCPTRTCYWVTGGGHMPSCHSDSGAGLGEARSSHDSLHPCALPAAVQEIWIFEEYSPPVFEAVHPQAHEWCRWIFQWGNFGREVQDGQVTGTSIEFILIS